MDEISNVHCFQVQRNFFIADAVVFGVIGGLMSLFTVVGIIVLIILLSRAR